MSYTRRRPGGTSRARNHAVLARTNTQLVAALGGDPSVLAFYDVRSGITVNAGAVSQWDDSRGAVGFAPSLAQATAGKRPVWDAAGLTMTFDGVDDDLVTAASPLFDLVGARTVVLVGAILTAVATKYAFGIADAAALTRGLCAYVNTATSRIIGSLTANGATSDATSLAIASATRRLVCVSKPADGSLAIVDVPNQVRATFAHAGTAAAGNNVFIVGSRFDTIAGMPSVVRAALVLDHAITPAEVQAILGWAQVNHDAVTA